MLGKNHSQKISSSFLARLSRVQKQLAVIDHDLSLYEGKGHQQAQPHSTISKINKQASQKGIIKSKKAVHGTQEWAEHNLNIQKGCENSCLYCFARTNKGRFKKEYKNDWDKPVLRNKIIDKGYRKVNGRYMFPTTHDIVPANLKHYIKVLNKLVEVGNEVLIVSKPHYSCIKSICNEFKAFKKQIMFRFTIGSTNNETLKFWETNAPSFTERLKALRYAHQQGYQTSVSAEPMLDTNMDALVRAVKPCVSETIWLGRINNLRLALSLNVPGNKEAFKKAEALLSAQSDEWVMELYKRYKDDPKISWKDSIKKVVGLKRPTKKGLDV